MRPLEPGTEAARVQEIGPDHRDSARRQRPRSVTGGIAAGNPHREFVRPRERVHDSTTLQTRPPPNTATTCLVIALPVPDASPSVGLGRAPAAAPLSDPRDDPANLCSRTYSGADRPARSQVPFALKRYFGLLPMLPTVTLRLVGLFVPV
jgi:hypothetical protein